jgi:hypothetical protein
MDKISDHISYRESVRSSTADRLGIENKPGQVELVNMEIVAERIFEPLRDWVGGPIRINSFYRGPQLNKAIGGSKRSQHMEGRAMDLDDTYGHKTNAEMFYYIKQNLDFDQLIWEFGTDENPNWIHVSYVSEDGNRQRCLKAYKDADNKTKYMVI